MRLRVPATFLLPVGCELVLLVVSIDVLCYQLQLLFLAAVFRYARAPKKQSYCFRIVRKPTYDHRVCVCTRAVVVT